VKTALTAKVWDKTELARCTPTFLRFVRSRPQFCNSCITAAMGIKMAFRSVNMNLFNMTSHPLKIADSKLEHGTFTAPFAPETVLPDQRAEWRAESRGGSVLTGVQGSLDYTIDGPGVNIHFNWDNPASGDLFIEFIPPTTNATGGGPSDFVYFATVFGLDNSADAGVVAVTQTNESSDDNDIIFPFPLQTTQLPNARFSIGVRNKKDPWSLRRWLKATGLDRQSIGAILVRPLSFRKIAEIVVASRQAP
jgi:hypothetical protein